MRKVLTGWELPQLQERCVWAKEYTSKEGKTKEVTIDVTVKSDYPTNKVVKDLNNSNATGLLKIPTENKVNPSSS